MVDIFQSIEGMFGRGSKPFEIALNYMRMEHGYNFERIVKILVSLSEKFGQDLKLLEKLACIILMPENLDIALMINNNWYFKSEKDLAEFLDSDREQMYKLMIERACGGDSELIKKCYIYLSDTKFGDYQFTTFLCDFNIIRKSLSGTKYSCFIDMVFEVPLEELTWKDPDTLIKILQFSDGSADSLWIYMNKFNCDRFYDDLFKATELFEGKGNIFNRLEKLFIAPKLQNSIHYNFLNI